MKARKILLLYVCCAIFLLNFAFIVKAFENIVYCNQLEGLSVTLIDTLLPPDSGQYENNQEVVIDVDCPINGATQIGEYNCHYYTFFYNVTPRYNAISNQLAQLDDYDSFLILGEDDNDGVYTEESDRHNAEIIAYFDSSTNRIFHTGVVYEVLEGTPISSTNDSNLVRVKSKWDNGFVFSHRGDQYPLENEIINYYIKYFSYSHNHTHDYEKVSINDYTHRKTCESNLFCRLNLIENHDINYSSINASYHRKYCSECNYNSQEGHDWRQVSDILFVCNDCNVTARFIPIIHDGIVLPNNNYAIIQYDGVYYFVVLEDAYV